MERFIHSTNVIDNNVVDAIGIFKSELQADFYNLKKRNTFRDDPATR
jgi:hypothetical protein